MGADLDYQLNLKLEMQLQELHLKVDELIKQSASSAPASSFSASRNGLNLTTAPTKRAPQVQPEGCLFGRTASNLFPANVCQLHPTPTQRPRGSRKRIE